MGLTKEDILGAEDFVSEKVSVPEWGGHVHVRTMTGTQRDAFEASVVSMHGGSTSPNLRDVRAKLAVFTLCDKDGKRLFGDADVAVLGQKSAAALDRVFAVAQRINGIGEDAIDKLAGE